MTDVLSDRVQRFLLRHVRRTEDLDVLVTLWRSGGRRWTVADLTAQLGTSELSVRTALEQLQSSDGVASADSEYWLSDAGDHREVLAEVADRWRTHKTRVIEFVYSRPSSGARAFADAFRLRKEEK